MRAMHAGSRLLHRFVRPMRVITVGSGEVDFGLGNCVVGNSFVLEGGRDDVLLGDEVGIGQLGSGHRVVGRGGFGIGGGGGRQRIVGALVFRARAGYDGTVIVRWDSGEGNGVVLGVGAGGVGVVVGSGRSGSVRVLTVISLSLMLARARAQASSMRATGSMVSVRAGVGVPAEINT